MQIFTESKTIVSLYVLLTYILLTYAISELLKLVFTLRGDLTTTCLLKESRFQAIYETIFKWKYKTILYKIIVVIILISSCAIFFTGPLMWTLIKQNANITRISGPNTSIIDLSLLSDLSVYRNQSDYTCNTTFGCPFYTDLYNKYTGNDLNNFNRSQIKIGNFSTNNWIKDIYFLWSTDHLNTMPKPELSSKFSKTYTYTKSENDSIKYTVAPKSDNSIFPNFHIRHSDSDQNINGGDIMRSLLLSNNIQYINTIWSYSTKDKQLYAGILTLQIIQFYNISFCESCKIIQSSTLNEITNWIGNQINNTSSDILQFQYTDPFNIYRDLICSPYFDDDNNYWMRCYVLESRTIKIPISPKVSTPYEQEDVNIIMYSGNPINISNYNLLDFSTNLTGINESINIISQLQNTSLYTTYVNSYINYSLNTAVLSITISGAILSIILFSFTILLNNIYNDSTILAWAKQHIINNNNNTNLQIAVKYVKLNNQDNGLVPVSDTRQPIIF